jgi:carboxyl-terminal processing protease
VGALQKAGACAWIVDVRANGGGNMWPMLAGIGSLLGDTIAGSFGGRSPSPRWYYKDGVSGILDSVGKLDTVSRVTVPPVRLRDPAAPIAVLFDEGTGSSGEAVVIAFIGRPNTRTFGSRSAGYATVNRGLRLADGANLVVTTGYNADRRGHVYGDQLIPDSTVTLPSGWPSPTDRVTASAIGWLAARTSCVHLP